MSKLVCNRIKNKEVKKVPRKLPYQQLLEECQWALSWIDRISKKKTNLPTGNLLDCWCKDGR